MTEARLLKKWAALLQKRSWSFIVNEAKHFLMLNVSKDGISHPVKVQFKEEASIVISTLSYKRKTPPEQRNHMINFINHINLEVSIGGFEMDRHDGEVRFRHSVDLESIVLSDIFVHNFMNTVAMTGCKYYNAMSTLMDGKVQEAYNMLQK